MKNTLLQTRLAHAALFVVATVYGINYIWAKDVMPNWVQPSAFILLRITGASLLFMMLRFSSSWRWPDRKDVPRLFFSGLLGVAANQLMFFNGLNLTSPINASIIMTISPLLVVVFGLMARAEKLTLRRGIGFIVAAAGAVGLILIGKSINSIQSHPFGDLLILLNASSYAGYLVVVQPLMKKYRAIDVIQWVFFFGWIIALPFGIQGALEVEWAELPGIILAKIGFVIVATTFLVYLLNLFAISVVGSSTVGLYIYLQPLIATFFALLTGSETPHIAQIACGILVIIGVVLGSFKRRQRAETALGNSPKQLS